MFSYNGWRTFVSAPAILICYPKGCAATSNVQCQCNARGSLSKLAGVPPRRKINVTSKSPVGDISVVTLIRTDTTLDHSQKAEKVWQCMSATAWAAHVKVQRAACIGGGFAFLNGRMCTPSYRSILIHSYNMANPLGRGPHKNCKNDLDDQT